MSMTEEVCDSCGSEHVHIEFEPGRPMCFICAHGLDRHSCHRCGAVIGETEYKATALCPDCITATEAERAKEPELSQEEVFGSRPPGMPF